MIAIKPVFLTWYKNEISDEQKKSVPKGWGLNASQKWHPPFSYQYSNRPIHTFLELYPSTAMIEKKNIYCSQYPLKYRRF